MRKPRTYTIAEMAKRSSLTLRTLRFYESRGLLSPTRVGQTRIYSEDDCLRLADLARWRSQGFTIAEMKDALRDGGFSKETIAAQIQHLRRQCDEIDNAIAELMQAEQRPVTDPKC